MEPKSTRLELDAAVITSQVSAAPGAMPATQPEPAPAIPAVELPPEQLQQIEEQVVVALRTCFDPEIPVNIYELGLIYSVDVSSTGAVHIRMTLTSPACPAAGSLPPEVQAKARGVPGVTAAKVDVVWDPPWDKDMMSEAARLELGLFD